MPVVKGKTNTRSGFMGEIEKSPETDILLNFKQIPREYTREESQIAEEKEQSVSNGFPRSFLDNINESLINKEDKLISDSGYSTFGIFYTSTVSDLFDGTDGQTKVGNFRHSYLTSTSNYPSDAGTARSLSLFFKPSVYDLEDNTDKEMFSQIYTNGGYHLGIEDKRLYCYVENSAGTKIISHWLSGELSYNTWYHIIISHDGSDFKAYLNGERTLYVSITGTPHYVKPYRLGRTFSGLMSSMCCIPYYLDEDDAKAFQNTAKNTIRLIPETAEITTTGSWTELWDNTKDFSKDTVLRSNTANDTFELDFYGNEIDLYLREYPSGGLVNIYLDDEFKEQIDLNGVSDVVYMVATYSMVKSNHTLKLEVVSGYTDIDYFVIYDSNYVVGIYKNELHPDRYQKYPMKEYSDPTGFRRCIVDGGDETGRHYSYKLDGEESSIICEEGAGFTFTDRFVEADIKVLNCANGWARSTVKPTSDGGTQRAVGIWFRPSSSDLDSRYKTLATQRYDTSSNRDGYHLAINTTNRPHVNICDSSGSVLVNYNPSTGSQVQADTWYLLTIVHDSSSYYVYLNGNLHGSGSFTGTPSYTLNYFKFGSGYNTNVERFYGQLRSLFVDSMGATFWTSTEMQNYYDNVFYQFRYYPTIAKQTLTGNWEWTQKIYNSTYPKHIVLNDIGDSIEIEVTAREITIAGSRHNNGGVFDVYIDDELKDTINTYNATQDQYEEFFEWDTGYPSPEEPIKSKSFKIKIVNTSGNPVWLHTLWVWEAYNIILDESGKDNHLMSYYFADYNTPVIESDRVLLSKYEFMINAINSKYPYIPEMYIPTNYTDEYLNVGDRIFIGATIKPTEGHTLDTGMIIFDNTITGSNNQLVRFAYVQDRTSGLERDSITVAGDFINVDVDIGILLYEERYYFIGILIDDILKTVDIIVYNITSNILSFSSQQSFIASTTYPRDNFNQTYIQRVPNSSWGMGKMDSFIYEGNTQRTKDEIIHMLKEISLATGGDQETPSDVLAVYDIEPKLKLRKESEKIFTPSGEYYSRAYDTGLFEGSAKINVIKELPVGTTITVQTRTSNNAHDLIPTWTAWENVNEAGIIASENRRWIQVKLVLYATADLSQSPSINMIQVLDVDRVPYLMKAFSYPVTYDLDGYKESVIHDCTNLHEVVELNGAKYMTFDLPKDSEKSEFIIAEKSIRLYDEFYIIRIIEDMKINNINFIRVYCEPIFYNLGKAQPLQENEFFETAPSSIIDKILQYTDWELIQCDVGIKRDFSWEKNANVLETLRKVQEVFGGDLLFNNEDKTIKLLLNSAVDNGVIFAYRKNMKDIGRKIDSTNLANRVYVYGENDIDIRWENDGKEYLENDISAYVPEGTIYSKIITNGDISDATVLKNYGNYIKDKYSTPDYTYTLTAKDLSTVEGLDLQYSIGDLVTCFDETLGIELKTRIVAIDYNILLPQESVITLSNIVRSLGDDMTQFKIYMLRLKRLNWSNMIKMFRTFLKLKMRKKGWIEKTNIVTKKVSVGTIGQVRLDDVDGLGDVRVLPVETAPIVSSLRHGDTVTIKAISDEWYFIEL